MEGNTEKIPSPSGSSALTSSIEIVTLVPSADPESPSTSSAQPVSSETATISTSDTAVPSTSSAPPGSLEISTKEDGEPVNPSTTDTQASNQEESANNETSVTDLPAAPHNTPNVVVTNEGTEPGASSRPCSPIIERRQTRVKLYRNPGEYERKIINLSYARKLACFQILDMLIGGVLAALCVVGEVFLVKEIDSPERTWRIALFSAELVILQVQIIFPHGCMITESHTEMLLCWLRFQFVFHSICISLVVLFAMPSYLLLGVVGGALAWKFTQLMAQRFGVYFHAVILHHTIAPVYEPI